MLWGPQAVETILWGELCDSGDQQVLQHLSSECVIIIAFSSFYNIKGSLHAGWFLKSRKVVVYWTRQLPLM